MRQLLIALALFVASQALAIMPPMPGELAAYKKDGSYAKRLEFTLQTRNHRVRPDVAQNTWARLNNLVGLPKGLAPTPLPRWQGMPTKGTNNLLVFLIDFPDYPHVNDAATITNKLFGEGTPNEFPRESLRNYYRRSSYNQLELRGNALGWYRMQHTRNWYTTTYADRNEANRAIIQEVISNYDPVHDFSQYDNNQDGDVDYFAVIWAGPDNGWANFWWGYQWSLNNPISADGVQFKNFSWQWESRPVGSAFEAATIIHETGHALGLPDYYDYDSSIPPNGGLGGLDMMDGVRADHNGFSKFMLDWVTPTVVPAGLSNVTLWAQCQSNMVAIMPGYSGSTPYTEFFFAENRFRTNNDTGNPGDGILIWHVDATPDSRGEDFQFNNSYGPHKLLRLMEADGLEEIDNGGVADAGDYYNQGAIFSDVSAPNSRSYSGTNTYVTFANITPNGPVMTLSAAIQPQTGPCVWRSPGALSASTLAGATPPNTSISVYSTGGALSYAISNNAPWLTVIPASGNSSGQTNRHEVTFATDALAPGLYYTDIIITAPGASNSPQTIAVSLTIMGNGIGHAVNATNFSWSSGGSSLWFEQNTVSYDGQAAAQSGPLADLQTNWIETTVAGPGILSFWWKVSSEQDYDFLRFYLDGRERPGSISGTLDWQFRNVVLGTNAHTVRWAYDKDVSYASGLDAGWVDQVSFLPTNIPPLAANLALAEAVDFTNAIWTTDANAPWTLVNSPTHDGQDSAQSGLIPDNGSSWASVAVQGPGLLSFWWKVSSESGFDFVDVLVDNEYLGLRMSGEMEWQQTSVEIASGNHVVEWLYSKDDSFWDGQDAAWLDEVSFTPAPSGIDTLLFTTFSSGLPPGWSVLDNIGYGDEWFFNDPAGRGNWTGGAGGFAIADSDFAWMEMDTELRTPALNFASYTNSVLEFKSDFYVYNLYETYADIDISLDGGSIWSNIWRHSTDFNGTVSLSLPRAAGQSNVTLRFRYRAALGWWWELDDVKITGVNSAWLNRPQVSVVKLPPDSIVLSWPGDAAYRYTLLHATNLSSAPWVLAPGWTSNSVGVAPFMNYTNSTPRNSEFYRIQMR